MSIVCLGVAERKGPAGLLKVNSPEFNPLPPGLPGRRLGGVQPSVSLYQPPEGLFGDDDGEPDGFAAPLSGRTTAAFDPRAEVARWRITRAGRKPGYFLARDCLYASLFRSPLPAWFHRSVAKPPAWMADLVGHLLPRDRPAAIRQVALHYLHLRRLARLAQSPGRGEGDGGLGGGAGGGYAIAVLDRLRRCWPYGLEVRWDGDGERTARDVCDLAWLCPWCYARRVVAVHERLTAGPLRAPEGKFLLQGRLAIPLGDGTPDGAALDEGSCQGLRDVAGASLRQASERMGVCGGLTTFQVAPHRGPGGQGRGLCAELGVVGELTPGGVESLRGALESRLDGDYALAGGFRNALGDVADSVRPSFDTWVGVAGDEHPVRWNLLPARPGHRQDAARMLLAGTSTSYPLSDNLGLYDADSPGDVVPFRSGLPGVFGWPATFLFSDAQWLGHASATKGMSLYRTFGTWRGALGSARKALKAPVLPYGRRTRRADRVRLDRVNAERQRSAGGRLHKLLEAAKPLWPEVLARCEGRKGRPPHRAVLQEVLEEQGVVASRRDLTRLVKSLSPVDGKEEA